MSVEFSLLVIGPNLVAFGVQRCLLVHREGLMDVENRFVLSTDGDFWPLLIEM